MTAKYILPEAEIIQRYQAGEAEKTIAASLGISRGPIHKILKNAGVTFRTPSETQQKIANQLSPEQRNANTKAAHNAVRGAKQSLEHRCKIAKTNQEKQLHVSPAEQLLQEWLKEYNINSIPQFAIGPYNVDLAFDHIAIEIYGGGWHSRGRHRARANDRFNYLLEQGWNIIIVWVDTNRGWILSRAAITFIVSVSEQTNKAPTIRVINGLGREFAKDSSRYIDAIGL